MLSTAFLRIGKGSLPVLVADLRQSVVDDPLGEAALARAS